MAKIKKPKSFTIDRTKWARGGKGVPKGCGNTLLNSNGTMCCLGFYSKACGVPADVMRGETVPSRFRDIYPVPGFIRNGWIVSTGHDSFPEDLEDAAAGCNDRKHGIDESTREAQIIAGFKHFLGVDVKFVGKGFPEA